MMRVGGIVSGMDIEAMVNKLMEAERMPLQKLQQQQTTLEWKRDAFREVNSSLLELDNIVRDMKYTSFYNSKSTTSSNNSVATATAGSGASNGSYDINVETLAKGEMQVSEYIGGKKFKASAELANDENGHHFSVYDKYGEKQTFELKIEEGDSLEKILSKVDKASGGTVRAFFDENTEQVVFETKRTGVYNKGGREIEFEGAFFNDKLKMNDETHVKHTQATNAEFTYNNGLTLTSKDNSYSLNGMTFNFTGVGETKITVDTDVDKSMENIKKFVDKYNEVIDMMNKSQNEERFRSYKPLSEEEKEAMSDKQIELWEEKAKSGLLRGEATIRDGMYALRASLQGRVDGDGPFNMLSSIGIKTTANYLDGGKLEIDEDKLRKALTENPEGVYDLFVNNSKGEDRGLIHRFDDALERTRAQIERKAGKSTATLDNYAIGKEIKLLNSRISDFERKMVTVEQRYWNQFTAMEKAISNLNQQSQSLFSQFGM